VSRPCIFQFGRDVCSLHSGFIVAIRFGSSKLALSIFVLKLIFEKQKKSYFRLAVHFASTVKTGYHKRGAERCCDILNILENPCAIAKIKKLALFNAHQ